MIRLTRLSGSEFILNSDHIERIDSTPDTVITLMHGTKYVVAESPAEIVELVQLFRSNRDGSPYVSPETPTPRLRPVRGLKADRGRRS